MRIAELELMTGAPTNEGEFKTPPMTKAWRVESMEIMPPSFVICHCDTDEMYVCMYKHGWNIMRVY